MNTKKTIDALNSLIEINNDRIAGYRTALEETLQEDLKTLFPDLIQTSEECKIALIGAVRNSGGTPVVGTNSASLFFRVWMDIKYALTCNDRYTILNSCEKGEAIAVETYTAVLSDAADDLSELHQEMLQGHLALLKADYDKITVLYEISLESD